MRARRQIFHKLSTGDSHPSSYASIFYSFIFSSQSDNAEYFLTVSPVFEIVRSAHSPEIAL